MSDWRILSLVAMIAALVLAISNLRAHPVTANFAMRSAAIWAVIICVVTVLVVYRFEIGGFFSPATAMMP
jgi:predicted aspartyl protease